jgi:hypothetical protein
MEEKSKTPLEELRKAVIDQKTVEFPAVESDDADIQDAVLRLKDYDRLVSQAVIQVLNDKMPGLYAEQKDPDLDGELTALHQIKSDRGQKIIEQLVRYKERLDRMFDLALLVVQQTEGAGSIDSDVNLVSVYSANGMPEAEMIRGLLENLDIPATTSQESAGQTMGLAIGAMGTAEVLVPSTYASRAREILEAYQRGDYDQTEGQDAEPAEGAEADSQEET